MAKDTKKRADRLFGQIAVRLGIVTRKQLEEALELQRFATTHKPLGVILIELKYVTEKDLERIVAAQQELVAQATIRNKAVREDNFFGKVAIRLGFSNEVQVAECLSLQENLPPQRFMRLGDIMVIKGYLQMDQVKKITDAQKGLIIYCPMCETQYNVVMFRPGANIQCYRCGTAMEIPKRITSASDEEALYFS